MDEGIVTDSNNNALRRQHLAQIRAVGGHYDALARESNKREKDVKYAITLGM